MSTFSEAFLFARKRHKGKGSGKRFKEILEILRRHDVAEGLTPDKAVALLEELGATFVKLGQIASTHPDVLPKEYCDAFGKLRAHVTPMDFETVKGCVERELARPLGDVFSDFDPDPSGSASIAQVHRAVLAEDGCTVAVKVQRPGVAETVAEDLAIMERIVELYDMVAGERDRLSLKELVEELARTSRDELDFTIEAANLVRFRDNNLGRAGIGVPRCYQNCTTSGLLVEDHFSSPRAGDVETLGLSEGQRTGLARLMADNYIAQVLDDGFYHADPHAGNILIAAPDRIEWIDFGMMGELSPREREQVLGIARAVSRSDAYGLQRALLKVVEPTGPIDYGKLLDICQSLIEDFADVELESFDLAALVNRLIDSMTSCGFKIAPFLVTLGRGLVTFEGTVKLVSSKLNIMEVIVEYLRANCDLSSVTRRVQRLAANGAASAEAVASLPTKALDTIDMLQRGQIKVGMDLNVGERFSRELVAAIGNFAFAVLACGMIVGSCILCMTDLEPRFLGIPLFGFLGFCFGTALMVYVSYLILKTRSKRKR